MSYKSVFLPSFVIRVGFELECSTTFSYAQSRKVNWGRNRTHSRFTKLNTFSPSSNLDKVSLGYSRKIHWFRNCFLLEDSSLSLGLALKSNFWQYCEWAKHIYSILSSKQYVFKIRAWISLKGPHWNPIFGNIVSGWWRAWNWFRRRKRNS